MRAAATTIRLAQEEMLAGLATARENREKRSESIHRCLKALAVVSIIRHSRCRSGGRCERFDVSSRRDEAAAELVFVAVQDPVPVLDPDTDADTDADPDIVAERELVSDPVCDAVRVAVPVPEPDTVAVPVMVPDTEGVLDSVEIPDDEGVPVPEPVGTAVTVDAAVSEPVADVVMLLVTAAVTEDDAEIDPVLLGV
jgi:hypothetical protein